MGRGQGGRANGMAEAIKQHGLITEECAGGPLFATPRFFKAPVAWLIRLDKVPNELAMHAAVCALVRRHASLRAIPYPVGDEAIATICVDCVPIVFHLRKLLGESGDVLTKRLGAAFLATFPHVRVPSPSVDPKSEADHGHFQWLKFDSEAELLDVAWFRSRSRGFRTPFSVAVFLVNEKDGGPVRAHLHVAVNHG